MTNSVTIGEIERAINYWCTQQRSDEGGALCARARPLADVYGLTIYQRAAAIDASELTPEQLEAIRIALY